MSFARYSREVRLDDLNNVHTFAVLGIPPGSRVLDLGAGDGSVARVLTSRGCLVTAIERDAGAVEVLRAHGVAAIQADLETFTGEQLGDAIFDVVLLLDVLEHLADPRALLSRTTAWLAAGGRVLISVPNVAHAAVRLALLQGRFPRTDVGLLDRTHLQFLDEVQLRALVEASGLDILDLLAVDRDLQETEVEIDPSSFAPEVIAAATSDASSRVYQFFVVARPSTVVGVGGGGLLQALQERQRTIEASYRALEAYATTLDAEMLRLREHLELREAHLRHEREQAEARAADLAARLAVIEGAPADVAGVKGQWADLAADRSTLTRQLTERMAEIDELTGTVAVLAQEVAVHRDFAESLVAQLPRVAARGGDAQVVGLLERFEAVAPTPEAAVALATDAGEYRRLRGALAIRALARVDGVLRRHPRVRQGLRVVSRWLARQA
ncbi:MAG TPA: methyltransferase domain-containing protein [Luteitalea sp.]|nr:methyltransferase domain-containing protein [Luteitalea sp.]